MIYFMTNLNVCYIEFFLIQLTLYISKKFIACQFKSVEIKKSFFLDIVKQFNQVFTYNRTEIEN